MKYFLLLFHLLMVGLSCTDVTVHGTRAPAGGWSGGGGSGVSCDNKLEILDYWEVEQEYLPVKQDESVDAYLARMVDNLKDAAPTFSHILKDALSRIAFFKAEGKLPKIDDVGKIQRPLNNCEIVQIAVRYAQATTSGKANAYVKIDEQNFNALGAHLPVDQKTINQALLKLHEAVYLIGYELGHLNSEQTRKLSRLLLNKQFYSSLDFSVKVTGNTREQIFSAIMTYLNFAAFASLHSNDLPENNVLRIRQRGFVESLNRANEFIFIFLQQENLSLNEFVSKTQNSPDFLTEFILAGYKHDAPLLSNEGAFAVVASVAEQNGFLANATTIYHRLSADPSSKIKSICGFARKFAALPGRNFSFWQQWKFNSSWKTIRNKALEHCKLEGFSE